MSLNKIANTPDSTGAYDDATDDGAIRSKLVTGELIRLPFRDGAYVTTAVGTTGSPFVNLETGGSFPAANPDGSGTLIHMGQTSIDVTAAGSGACSLWHEFYGTVYGVRLFSHPLTGPGEIPFSVDIDGVSYAVNPHKRANSWIYTEDRALNPVERILILATDLPDTMHTARWVWPCAKTTANPVSYIYGYIAERRAGLQERVVHTDVLFNSGTVPTGSTAIALNGAGTDAGAVNPEFVRRVDYYNGDNAQRTVTIVVNGLTHAVLVLAVGATASWPGSASGAPFRLNGGTSSSFNALVKHNVDSGAAVSYFVWGGM